MPKYCPNPKCAALIEAGVPAEYRDDVEACPECETRLVSGEPPPDLVPKVDRETKAEKPPERQITVATFGDKKRAAAAREVLTTIELKSSLGTAGDQVVLRVAESQARRARGVLEDHFPGELGEPPEELKTAVGGGCLVYAFGVGLLYLLLRGL